MEQLRDWGSSKDVKFKENWKFVQLLKFNMHFLKGSFKEREVKSA